MNARTAMNNRLLVVAPWVTIGALIALSFVLPNSTADVPDDAPQKQAIAQAVDDLPIFIGRWIGVDVEDRESTIPREAQKLLKPNAYRQLRYTGGGPTVFVLIVHCSDARDMIGHYPPICYPSAGWEESDPANRDLTLSVSGIPFPVREYGFKGYREGGREEIIRIFDAFVLPDGTVTREIDDINRQSERLSVSVQGVAQLQVITSGRVSADEAVVAAEEILGGMSGLFAALGASANTDAAKGAGRGELQ
jgi:hypothetical protein